MRGYGRYGCPSKFEAVRCVAVIQQTPANNLLMSVAVVVLDSRELLLQLPAETNARRSRLMRPRRDRSNQLVGSFEAWADRTHLPSLGEGVRK